jgi:hypothetical protein
MVMTENGGWPFNPMKIDGNAGPFKEHLVSSGFVLFPTDGLLQLRRREEDDRGASRAIIRMTLSK